MILKKISVKIRSGWYWIIGFLAFVWILLRTGLNPRRITYPCQQAAFPIAIGWILGIIAFLCGSVILRKFAKFSSMAIFLGGVIWFITTIPDYAGARKNSISFLPVWEVDNPVSTVFVMDKVPPTMGSLAEGDASVSNKYLTDPAVDTLLAMMETKGIYLHQTNTYPDGIVGSDHVVIIKGNFQWTSRNTTSTDRIKGLIWQILQHPDGFSGEIIICDNTQSIGTGINERDNNSEDPQQSIPDVVSTFFDKGYPVYYLDWVYIWDVVASEYSVGDYDDGYIYETSTKISYPKFVSPSGNIFISMRYGIWDSISTEYDKSRLCIIDFPVLKSHVMAGATIAVKNWIGMLTTAYPNQRYGGWEPMHYTYFFGKTSALVARVMEVTYPKLVFLDAAWTSTVNPNVLQGLVNTKMFLASTDPVAVSWYAAKYILTPIASDPGITNPDSRGSRYYNTLSAWTSYLQNAGLACTKDSSKISVYDRNVLKKVSTKGKKPYLAENFRLYENYPNPFNTSTIIHYILPERTQVILTIYDLMGREVKTVVNAIQESGYHSLYWNGTSDLGFLVSTGVYICQLKSGDNAQTRKMLLIK